MTRSSSINDLIPLGQRSQPAPQKPRSEARDAGFDRALNEADRSGQNERAQRKPLQEARPRDDQRSFGRSEEHTSRPEESPRSDRAERRLADDAKHAERHEKHKVEKHDPETHGNHDAKAKDAKDPHCNDSAGKPEKAKTTDTASEAKPEAGADKTVAENAVVAAEPAVAVTTPALNAEALLAALNAPVAAESVVSEATTADALATAAQTQSSQVAVQAAAPVVADSAVKAAAEPTEKAMIAAQAAAPVSSLEKTAATLGDAAKATSGPEGAEGAKPTAKKLDTAELSTASQTSANTAARDFAKVLDQVSSPQSSNQGTGIVSTSPAATAIADAAQMAKPATPADAMARADAPVPLQAMAVEIGMRAMRGSKEFSIRLDPEDLGRVDIRLEVSEEGQVQAKVVVERVETLQLLQRDAKTLERAFDQAGLKTSADGLQFSLRDPGQQARDNQQGQQGRSSSRNDTNADKTAVEEIALRPAIYRMSRNSGLDIRI
ncbi:MAG: flagellar hook-length control protein FliK [Beijerinckiaceae bacterium]